jgi:hypothetical protein
MNVRGFNFGWFDLRARQHSEEDLMIQIINIPIFSSLVVGHNFDESWHDTTFHVCKLISILKLENDSEWMRHIKWFFTSHYWDSIVSLPSFYRFRDWRLWPLRDGGLLPQWHPSFSKVPSCCLCEIRDLYLESPFEGAKLEKVTIKLPHEMTSGELIPKSPLLAWPRACLWEEWIPLGG